MAKKIDRKTVTWEPFTADHAIERVRIVIHFAQAIQSKQVQSFAALVEKQRSELELGPQTATATNFLEIDASTGKARVIEQPTGWSFSKTTSEGAPVEALILNPQYLCYEAASYDGWTDFWQRYDTITRDMRSRVQSDINVRAVALEYLDRFRFVGKVEDAQPGLLVRDALIGPLPEAVRSGRELWHVHRGWFEGNEPRRFLVNQNFDAQAIQDPEGVELRGVGALTKVERQSQTGDLDISSLPDDIDAMHMLSKRIVCDALVDEMCKRVGLSK